MELNCKNEQEAAIDLGLSAVRQQNPIRKDDFLLLMPVCRALTENDVHFCTIPEL